MQIKYITFLLISLYPILSFADDSVYKIGVITPLTGGLSTIGNALKNGIELAREVTPESFENIEFIYEDDQFDAKQSISAYNKLKDIDKVNIIFGFGVKVGNALAPVAEKDKMLLVNFSFEAAPVVGKQYVMRPINSTRHYMQVFAEYMKSNNFQTSSYLRTEISFFTAMANDFKNAMGLNYLIDESSVVNPDDNDFRTLILKQRFKQNAYIGLFLLPSQIISFVNQAKSLGFNFNYYGTDLFETAAEISSAENLFDGSLYPDNEVTTEFRTKYFDKYGNEAQLTFAGNAYEMARLFAEFLNKQKSYNALNFIKSLSTIENRNSVLGEYRFNAEDDVGMYFDFPIVVKEISGSRGKVVN